MHEGLRDDYGGQADLSVMIVGVKKLSDSRRCPA